MRGFRYGDWDDEIFERARNSKELRDLFQFLLLKTNGDPEQAFDLMRMLKERGVIDADVDVDELKRRLAEEGSIEQDDTGRFVLTDKGVIGMRKSSLEFVFRDMKGGESGGHATSFGGGDSLSDSLPERRPFAFGDDLRAIDFTESLWNTVRRTGTTSSHLTEDDLVVRDTERNTSCATVVLLDVSHSMILYGEDRFLPAKQVTLALTELILTRFRRDTLDVVLFGDDAIPVPIHDLPFASVGPFHTNTKAGLQYARKILMRRKNPNKQIFLVTDGKPTVIDIPGEGRYKNTFGLDDRIINRTLDEAVVCKRKGIRITTFMVTEDPYLWQFVYRLTELNRGRAYQSSPERLGGYLFVDFIRNRQRRMGPGLN